jgi:hypothetical protein
VRSVHLASLALIATILGAVPLLRTPRAQAQSDAGASHAPPRCREQRADPDLIRSNYIPIGASREVERHRRELAVASIRVRTERYGYFRPFGNPEWNAHPPSFYAENTRFMGLSVRVHHRIVPALACVEAEIHRACSAHPYRAEHLVGIRPANSYTNDEVSNHVFGIAIDVDANRNPCCGCGAMYRDYPACRRHVHSVWERMEMPECWVDAFERFGFYWLGHDRDLRDLMHFEFLGDPDRILE